MDLTISAEDLRKTMQDEEERIFQALMADIRIAAGKGSHGLHTSHYGFDRRFVGTDRMNIIDRLCKLGYIASLTKNVGKWAPPYELFVSWW